MYASTFEGFGASVSEIDWTIGNPEPTWRILQQSNLGGAA